jgi:hypothetical protein
MYNIIELLGRFDYGTKSTTDTDCGLARGNPQWLGVLGLFGQSKITLFDFWMGLTVQSAI